MSGRRPPILRRFPSSSAIKVALSKHGRDSFKHGQIRQERLNESPVLNVDKQVIWQPLKKKFGIHVKKSMFFKAFKNKQCIIPRNKVNCRKPP